MKWLFRDIFERYPVTRSQSRVSESILPLDLYSLRTDHSLSTESDASAAGAQASPPFPSVKVSIFPGPRVPPHFEHKLPTTCGISFHTHRAIIRLNTCRQNMSCVSPQ